MKKSELRELIREEIINEGFPWFTKYSRQEIYFNIPVKVIFKSKIFKFKNLKAALKKFKELNPFKNTKNFTKGMWENNMIRFEDWDTYELITHREI